MFQGVVSIFDTATSEKVDHIVTAIEEIQGGSHEVRPLVARAAGKKAS